MEKEPTRKAEVTISTIDSEVGILVSERMTVSAAVSSSLLVEASNASR